MHSTWTTRGIADGTPYKCRGLHVVSSIPYYFFKQELVLHFWDFAWKLIYENLCTAVS